MAQDFDSLRLRLDSLLELDLDPAIRDLLLNEGYVELCARSEWTRATLDLGPTVTDQGTYSLPPEIDGSGGERILGLSVGGSDYGAGSPATGRALERGELYLRGYGVYWISFAQDGSEEISLYPAPSSAGQDISILAVIEPEPLVDGTDEPKVPNRFRSAIVDYAAAQAFGGEEDNVELRAFYQGEFDAKAAQLFSIRQSRGRRGSVSMQIEGYHF